MAYSLRDVIDMAPDAHMIVSAEHGGSSTLMNSGGVIFKMSDWSRVFVDRWWNHQERHLFSDQVFFLECKYCV